MEAIGFVGLGKMGSKMVERLLKADYKVIGYNRTKEKAASLISQGMQWADSPAEAVNGCKIILTSLANDAAMLAVMEGKQGLLSALTDGKLLVDMSTISPQLSRKLANQIAMNKGAMLDAPVSGNPMTVEQGKAAIMVGGDHAQFLKAKPILESIGAKVFYIGENGQALFLKLAININLAVQFYVFSEGMLLVQKAGLDLKKAVEIVQHSAIASPGIQQRAPYILEPPESPLFSINLMQKDLLLALDQGRELGVPLLTAALTSEALTATRGQGYGEKDLSILFESMKQMLEKHEG